MKAIIMVNGMHCKSCEMLIKDVLEETAGVKKAEPSFAKNSVVVEFDEAKVDAAKIKKIIKEQGYEVK
jgi:copper chaperone CopZ